MQPQATQPMSPFKQLFSGWLAKALTLSTIIFVTMISFAFAGDLYYQNLFLQLKKSNPTQVLAPFVSPSPIATEITDTPNPNETISNITGILSPTRAPNTTATPTTRTVTQVPGNTATVTTTHAAQATNTPTNPPQNTNTNSPTPTQGQIAGCFVVVSGYLYNMQSGVGTNAIDPNTGKAHIHTINDYQCGTQSSPIDMTAVYLDKHLAMGCAARLAPYIVTPPAPADPSCD
jgi:hypothetical protein